MNRFEAYAAYGKILAGLKHISSETFGNISLVEVAEAHIGPAYGYYIRDARYPCVVVPHFEAVVDHVGWHECRTP